MIILEDKVVLVRHNTDFPENSNKRWRVLVGKIVKDEELNVEKIEEGEEYGVDHINAICSAGSWSGITPNGYLHHFIIFSGEHFDIREVEENVHVAIVGTINDAQEEVVEGEVEGEVEEVEVKTINPELELDAE